jgi:uncharacterized membrane protein HdeD (DUF308 family)
MIEEPQLDEFQTFWQIQPTDSFQISPADIHQMAARLQRQINWRNYREYLAAVFLIPIFGYIFCVHDALLPRLGAALIIAGIIYAVYQLHRKGSANAVPSEMGDRACLDFYLRELQRQYNVLRNIWSWYLSPFIPGMALYLIGMTIQAAISPGANKLRVFLSFIGSALFIASIFYGIYRLNQRSARDLQHQIDVLKMIERK